MTGKNTVLAVIVPAGVLTLGATTLDRSEFVYPTCWRSI
jgi:hypothetical protein